MKLFINKLCRDDLVSAVVELNMKVGFTVPDLWVFRSFQISNSS